MNGKGDSDPPDDLARAIREALADLGIDADPSRIADHVRRLNRGLPAEDEFAAICAWLGKCELLHRLDQRQVPLSSTGKFQVPDLLVKFETAGAVLVEVKVRKAKKLSFKPDYLERLTNYASLTGLPLLIAWKFHGMWTLFDVRRLRKARTNFNIEFGEAMQHSLLGVLGGDFSYQLRDGAGIRLIFAKEELLETGEEDGKITETWRMRVADAYLSGEGGERRDDLHPETQQIIAVANLEESQDHSADQVRWSFTARGSQFAHMVLPQLIELEGDRPPGEMWRAIISRPTILRSIGNFSEAINRAYKEGIVHLILHLQPQSSPDFLPGRQPGK